MPLDVYRIAGGELFMLWDSDIIVALYVWIPQQQQVALHPKSSLSELERLLSPTPHTRKYRPRLYVASFRYSSVFRSSVFRSSVNVSSARWSAQRAL